MLHGIPAQFLRINKITQNFRTAFPPVLLEMLLMGEKNCFFSSCRECSELVEKHISSLSPPPPPLFLFVGDTESVYLCVS